jgi:hypothetical protein
VGRRICGQRCTAQKREAARRDQSTRSRIRYATDRHLLGCDPRTHGGTQAIYRALSATANGRASCHPRLARSPAGWQLARGAGYTAGLVSGPAQAGQAQVGGAQITNPIVTGGSSGPAEYLGGDIGDPPS